MKYLIIFRMINFVRILNSFQTIRTKIKFSLIYKKSKMKIKGGEEEKITYLPLRRFKPHESLYKNIYKFKYVRILFYIHFPWQNFLLFFFF